MPLGPLQFEVLNGEPDVAAPAIDDVVLRTPVVDLTDGPQDVVVEFDVTETGSGLADVQGQLQGIRTLGTFAMLVRVSGPDPETGTSHYRASFSLPDSTPAGAGGVSVYAQDRAGNRGYGRVQGLTILNEHGDTDAPVVESLEVLTPVVDKRVSTTVRFRAHLLDSGSGVALVSAGIHSPSAHYNTGFGAQLVSGDAHDGYWEGALSLPAASEAGTWTLGDLGPSDGVGDMTPSTQSWTFEVR